MKNWALVDQAGLVAHRFTTATEAEAARQRSCEEYAVRFVKTAPFWSRVNEAVNNWFQPDQGE